MTKRKILFISQELTPYLPESPKALRGRLVPQGIQEKGFEVRTFMPKYGAINERRNQLHEVIRLSGMNLIIDDTDHPLIIKVATLLPTRMQVYFIDNDDYFGHGPIKQLETHTSPEDNDERILFFIRGAIETVKKLRWAPEVIHCSGWISALAPLYLKKLYNDDPALRDAKVIYAVTDNDEIPQPIPASLIEKMLMDHLAEEDVEILKNAQEIDAKTLSRLAIAHADGVIFDSPEVDSTLADFARDLGKPLLEYVDPERPVEAVDAETIGRILEFYDSI